MKRYIKAVGAVWAVVAVFLFTMAMLWIGELWLAAAFGLRRETTAVALLVIGLAGGAVKAALDARKARRRCEALDNAINMWRLTREQIKSDPSIKDREAMLAVYDITIRAMENERARMGGKHRGG